MSGYTRWQDVRAGYIERAGGEKRELRGKTFQMPAQLGFYELTNSAGKWQLAASLLSAVGLHELIAHRLQEYEALALRLATDSAFQSEIRARLHQAIYFEDGDISAIA